MPAGMIGAPPFGSSPGTRAVSWPGRRGAGKEVRAVSKPKGRNAKVRRGKVTARKVSEVLTAIARLIRAVGAEPHGVGRARRNGHDVAPPAHIVRRRRERTFAARTAFSCRLQVSGSSRLQEIAVLDRDVRPRSDVGARMHARAPGIAKDPGARCAVAGVNGRQPQIPSPTWEARSTSAPSTTSSPME